MGVGVLQHGTRAPEGFFHPDLFF